MFRLLNTQYLRLAETGLGVDGANRIAEMLHVNSALTSLDLACEWQRTLMFNILWLGNDREFPTIRLLTMVCLQPTQ
jgi:hypothetical protein